MYNLAMPSPLFSFAFAFSFTMIGSASSLAALQSDIGFMFHPVQAILIKQISKAADRMSVDPPPTKLATSIFTATSKMLSSIWPTLLKKTYIIFNLTNCVRENVYIQLTNSDGDRYTKEQAPFRKLKNDICKSTLLKKAYELCTIQIYYKVTRNVFQTYLPHNFLWSWQLGHSCTCSQIGTWVILSPVSLIKSGFKMLALKSKIIVLL